MARGSRCSKKISQPCMRSFVAAKGERSQDRIALGGRCPELESSIRVESIEADRTAQLFGQLPGPAVSGSKAQAQRGWWKTAAQIPAWAFSAPRSIPPEAGAHHVAGQPKRALKQRNRARPKTARSRRQQSERMKGHRPLIGFLSHSERIQGSPRFAWSVHPETLPLTRHRVHSGGDAPLAAWWPWPPRDGPAHPYHGGQQAAARVGWLPSNVPPHPDRPAWPAELP